MIVTIAYKFLAAYKVLDLASGGECGFSSVVRKLLNQRDAQFKALGIWGSKIY
jgi:hypothetical protein